MYLPDTTISDDDDILDIFNFDNICIFSSSITVDKKVINSQIDKLLTGIREKQILCVILYKFESLDEVEIYKITNMCTKYNCKIIKI